MVFESRSWKWVERNEGRRDRQYDVIETVDADETVNRRDTADSASNSMKQGIEATILSFTEQAWAYMIGGHDLIHQRRTLLRPAAENKARELL